MAYTVLRFLFFIGVLTLILAVDHSAFKTCEQSSFCRRCRNQEPNKSTYELQLSTLIVTDHSIEAELVNTADEVSFKIILSALLDNTFRFQVDETKPLRERFRVTDALKQEPLVDKLEVLKRTPEYISVKSGVNTVILYAKPFRIDLSSDGILVVSANARGLLRFEPFKHKQQNPNPEENQGENEEYNSNVNNEDPGAWEENFKSHRDSKPFGPSAVALDFTFPGSAYAYGLPEHADSLVLKDTKGKTDPYRLYNLDVFEYELNNPMAIYGAVPLLYAHGSERTTGIFWHNAAETWVDVTSTSTQNDNVVNSIVNFVSGSNIGVKDSKDQKVETHFMSETGLIDVFFLLGPKPKDVIREYTVLTGVAPLPQYFSLGYHQSRWNYNDEKDVQTVSDNFDDYDMPMDVMWLDIEYTDNKKYFTWDPVRFPHPLDMQRNLTLLGRKLVVIIDPHIKRESGYFLHETALENGYYVNNAEGNVYEGWCWPGSSSYLDFLNPTVLNYYSSLYSLDKFPQSSNDMYLWNDMNEPSVFNGPEVTMPKDCMHFGGWEHRDIHNIYGLLQTKGTYQGLLSRSHGTRRPFILTRSHFAGSQRYAAVWTGDNAARWDHLQISIPMCLSLAIGGISLCGADIGGFFGYPEPELMVRWYQTGAFLSFYRAHSHIDTKRREPYLYPEDTRTVIRAALRKRYSYLPFWYTLFHDHETTGLPVMRPLFMEYPQDHNVWTIDNEFLLGDALLVRPVTESGANQVQVYFPGGNKEVWYDVDTYNKHHATGNVNFPVDIHKIPVFQRGGTIIPKKERIRRSSALTHDDPYTLVVALDSNGLAKGHLYIDDGESFEYKNGKYLHLKFEFKNDVLTARNLDTNSSYPTKSWLERVVVLGHAGGIKSATLFEFSAAKDNHKNKKLETVYDASKFVLTIRKPGISITEDWSIHLNK